MVVSVGMALMSTVTTGFAVSAGTGSFILGSAVSHFLVTTALGAALNALTPKPSIGGNTAGRGYQVTQTGSALDHQIVYGRVKVGGARVFDSTTGTSNKSLHRVLAFTGHEIESFDEIYINDAKITQLESDGNVLEVELPNGDLSDRYNGKVRIKEHLGTSDQAADSDLVAEVPEWTSAHRLRGIAYLYVRLTYNTDTFPNGVPEITATIKGKKVYDPRTDTTSWSDNPALCLRDYLTNTTYGLGEDESNVDDRKVIAAANVCDGTISDGSTRYTCNGSFTTGSTPYDNLSALLTSMGGLLWYAQGEWRMKPAYWTEPVITLNEDDLRGSITVNTRHSRRDNYNTVRGTFRGEQSNWQVTDYPDVTNNAFITADNGQVSSIDLALPFTDNAEEAQRIANVSLERNRQQLTVSASFGLRAFQLQVGDNIKLTNTRFGWDEKEFEVTSWTFGLVDGADLQVQMILREVSESVFDEFKNGKKYERDNTNLLSPFDVPDVGLVASAGLEVFNSEKLSNIMELTVSSAEPERIDQVEVQRRRLIVELDSEGDQTVKPEVDQTKPWIRAGLGELGVFSINNLNTRFKATDEDADPNVGVGSLYDFRARAVNTFGVKGDWVYVNSFDADGQKEPPEDVTGFSHQLSGGTIFLSWEPVEDLDLSHYRVHHSSNTSSGDVTWGNSEAIVRKVPRPGTNAQRPARAGTYLIKAYDKRGNESINPTKLVVQPSELPPLDNSLSLVENPDFDGEDLSGSNNVVINTTSIPDQLIIEDLSASNPSGTYEFHDVIDTGSSRVCRVTGLVTFGRYSPTSELWDDIPGKWDTWPGNFDTWTGEDADFDDHDVNVYVAATADNPNSGSPSWGPWQLANGSELVGRGFKFKAELISTNKNVSPSVKTLSATVEY